MGQAENCGEMEHCDGGIEHAAIEHAAIEHAAIEHAAIEHAVGGNPIIHCARAPGTVVRCADARSSVGIRCAGNPARGKDNADHRASGEEEVGFEE
jgi:hypothetical protein